MNAWLFSTIWLFASFEWISISLSKYGGMPAWMAWASILALAMGLAIYHAMAVGITCALVRHRSRLLQPLAMGSAWTLAELARSAWFTGFPWASPGYAHVDGALHAFAPYIGVMGITWVSSVLAALLAWQSTLGQANWLQRAGLHALVSLGLIWPVQMNSMGAEELSQSVTLLQANVTPNLKFEEGGRDVQNWYGEHIRSSTTQLTIAPETAIAVMGTLKEFQSSHLIEGMDIHPQKAFIIGAMERLNEGYANAAWALVQGEWHRYHKVHLVPFGEYIPPWFEWFAKWADIPYSNFTSGENTTNPLVHHHHVYAVGICYEDLFGDEMARLFSQSARIPTAIVNLSNLAWFGDGRPLDQHLGIGRMRAIEFRRPMLMSTNSGWSAVIDDTGRVVARLPKSQTGTLSTTYQGVESALTWYAKWAGQWGHWPLWMACALGILLNPFTAWISALIRLKKSRMPL